VLPRTIRAVSADAGGRPVAHRGLVLGGIMSCSPMPTSRTCDRLDRDGGRADRHDRDPADGPIKPLADLTNGWILTAAYRFMGGAPKALVKKAFQLSAFDKMITKPVAILSHLDDREFLAQIEAWTGSPTT